MATSVPKWLVISTKRKHPENLSRSRSRRKPKRKKSIALTVNVKKSKKSPTGLTERTPKPEYVLALASDLGVRWDSVPLNFWWKKTQKKNRAGLGLGFFFLETHAIYSQDHVEILPLLASPEEKKTIWDAGPVSFLVLFTGTTFWWICHPFSPPNNKPIFAAFLEGNQKRAASQTPKVGGWFSKEPPFFFSGTKERLNVNA